MISADSATFFGGIERVRHCEHNTPKVLGKTLYKMISVHFLGKVFIVTILCVLTTEMGRKLLGLKASKWIGLS